MISHTCLIAPTGVPVDVMTHCVAKGEPPFGDSRLLPAGQLVVVADEVVVPTIVVEMPTPETVAIKTAADSTTARGRNLFECKSFIRRTVTSAGYLYPSATTRESNIIVINPFDRDALDLRRRSRHARIRAKSARTLIT
jgi:hypothetical protein